MATATRTRLTMDQKLRALAMLARGDTLSQVAAYLLTEYRITISESALSSLKKSHRETIEAMQRTMAEAEAADAEGILKKTRRMMSAQLDRADRDGNALQDLDRKYREGEIEYSEYKRQKTGLMKITLNELNNLTKSMFVQTIKGGAPNQLPPGDAPETPQIPRGHEQTPAQLENMMKAIAAGNTVELQRMIFRPGAS